MARGRESVRTGDVTAAGGRPGRQGVGAAARELDLGEQAPNDARRAGYRVRGSCFHSALPFSVTVEISHINEKGARRNDATVWPSSRLPRQTIFETPHALGLTLGWQQQTFAAVF